MKIFTYILLGLLSDLALGSQQFVIAPEDRIRISEVSENLIVIEASKVEWRPAIEDKGLELRELLISGKVVEVVRGKFPDKVFTHSCQDIRVSNEEAFNKAFVEGSLKDMFRFTVESKKTGAAEVKAGLRYLVLYLLGQPYFLQVADNDQTWRDKILQLRPEPEYQKEPNKPAQTDGDKRPI